MGSHGELSERFMEPVLKTGDGGDPTVSSNLTLSASKGTTFVYRAKVVPLHLTPPCRVGGFGTVPEWVGFTRTVNTSWYLILKENALE